MMYSARKPKSTNFIKEYFMLIFIQKVQKRGFQNSEPQKICPNPILVPTASKTVPFDSF